MQHTRSRRTHNKSNSAAKKRHAASTKPSIKPIASKQKMNKKENQVYYHKRSRKWQRKYQSSFSKMPNEVLLVIFKKICEGVTMVDEARIELGDFRRKFGIQNKALICKKFKEIFEEAMFEECTFKIHQYRLHPKHRYLNPFNTLKRIQNLEVIWDPLPIGRKKITSKLLHIDKILAMEKLKVITLDIAALSIQGVELGNGGVELHENIIRHFNGRNEVLPKWAKRLIIQLSKVKVLLKYYFTAIQSAPRLGRQVQCATICCQNNTITKVDIIAGSIVKLRETRPPLYFPKLEGVEGYEKFGRQIPQRFRQQEETHNTSKTT